MEPTPLVSALKGRRLLITGSTGFIGEVLLAHILFVQPEVERVHLLVRYKGPETESVLFEELETSPVFHPIKRVFRDGLGAYLRSKIQVHFGDIATPDFGLEANAITALQRQLDAVIHLAGYVNLFPDLKKSIDVNTKGALHAALFSKKVGAKLVHVSTAFVTRTRYGKVPEQPVRFSRNFTDELAHVERFLATQPDKAACAQFAAQEGFLNAYCYSKALGELAIASVSDLTHTTLRPTIVESSLKFPFPGWNEGMTTSAPIIYFMLRGQTLWPIRKSVAFDIVPVDCVCNAITAVTAQILSGSTEPIYQLGSSDVPNALLFGEAGRYISQFRRTNKLRGDFGLPGWVWFKTRLPIIHVSLASYQRFSTPLLVRLLRLGLLGRLPILKTLIGVDKTIRSYLPFFYENKFYFETANIRSLFENLSPHDRKFVDWEVPEISWKNYWLDIHIKGLMKWVFSEISARPSRIKGARAWVRKILYKAQRWLYTRYFSLKVYGRENVPLSGRVIIASNHSSHLDMGLIKQALGPFGIRMYALAAQDYFFGSVLKRFFFKNFTNLLPMGRKNNIKASLKLASDRLKRSYPILIFPEGTRSTTGEIQEFKPSLGYLALRNKAGILPVYIEGTHQALPKGKLWPRAQTLTVRIAPLVSYETLVTQTAGLQHRDANRVISSQIEMIIRTEKEISK